MFDSGIPFEVFPGAAPLVKQPSIVGDKPSFVRQRTLKNPIHCSGIGLHSGARVAMTLNPAPAGSGIAFRRVDIAGQGGVVRADWASVSDTRLNTCIANADGVGVRTIEHLMAALSGAGVDNALIEVNGPEIPVMDGSANPFLFLVDCAGVAEQDAQRIGLRIKKPVFVEDGDKVASLVPSAYPSVKVAIDFAASAIRRQEMLVPLSEEAFRHDIARARTFGFEQEAAALRAAGLGKGGSLDNAVVISSDGERVLNDEGLRYDDEFVRHKILDVIGDLYLAGAPIVGAYRGVRPGHALNNRLLRTLFADASAWEPVALDDLDSALSASLSAPSLELASA